MACEPIPHELHDFYRKNRTAGIHLGFQVDNLLCKAIVDLRVLVARRVAMSCKQLLFIAKMALGVSIVGLLNAFASQE
jgi:hypothetical protein